MRTGPLKWVGGEHDFALDIGALRALQDCCDAGPEQIMRRVSSGDWRINDLFDTIRLGLITGEAMKGPEAARMVTTLFNQHPLVTFRATAQMILIAALVGVEGDPLGEPKGGTTSPPENGDSAPSTATAQ
jgi:hypothetical protein